METKIHNAQKSRIERITQLEAEGLLLNISEVSEQCWQNYTVLMQSELFDIINQDGTWLMIPTGVESDYECEQLIICLWQWLQFYPEFYKGGQSYYIPITISTIPDLMVITELLLSDRNIILITLSSDADIELFY